MWVTIGTSVHYHAQYLCAAREQADYCPRLILPPDTHFGNDAFPTTIRPSLCAQNRKFRLNMFPGFQGRFNSPRVHKFLQRYQAIAERYDLTLLQLALAFVHSRLAGTTSFCL